MSYLWFMVIIFIQLWLMKECFTIRMGIFCSYSNSIWVALNVVYTIFLSLIAHFRHKYILSILVNYTMYDYLLVICVPLLLLTFIHLIKKHIENYLYYKRLSAENSKLEGIISSKSDIINNLLHEYGKVNCPLCTEKDIRVLERPFEKIYVCRNCGRSFRVEQIMITI